MVQITGGWGIEEVGFQFEILDGLKAFCGQGLGFREQCEQSSASGVTRVLCIHNPECSSSQYVGLVRGLGFRF